MPVGAARLMAPDFVPRFIAFGINRDISAGGVVNAPVGRLVGDLLLLFEVVGQRASDASPSGWTPIFKQTVDPQFPQVWWKLAAGDATDNVTVTNTAGSPNGGNSTAVIAAYRGVNPVTPVDVFVRTVNGLAPPGYTTGALTPTKSGLLVCCFGSWESGQVNDVYTNNDWSVTAPQVLRVNANGSGGGAPKHHMAISDAPVQANTPVSGVGNDTVTISAGTNGLAGLGVVIRS